MYIYVQRGGVSFKQQFNGGLEAHKSKTEVVLFCDVSQIFWPRLYVNIIENSRASIHRQGRKTT